MLNGFKIKNSFEDLAKKNYMQSREEKLNEFNKLKRDRLSMKADLRRSIWIDTASNNESVMKNYISGACEYTEPTNASPFRQGLLESTFDKRNSIMSYNYKPSNERIKETEQKNKSSILEKGPYTDFARFAKNWLRNDDSTKEIQPRMIHKETDAANIRKKNIEENKIYNLESINGRLVHSPRWREDYRTTYKGSKSPYSKNPSMQTLNKNKSLAELDVSWRQSLNIGDPYKEGYVAAGDLTRKRDRSKELADAFIAGAPKDSTWEDKIRASQSLRTMKHSNTLLMLENMKECPQDVLSSIDKSPYSKGVPSVSETRKSKVGLRQSFEVQKEPKTYFKSLQSKVTLISDKIKAIKNAQPKRDHPYQQTLTKTPSSLGNLHTEAEYKQRDISPIKFSQSTRNLAGLSPKKEEQERQIVYLPKIK